MAPSGNEIVNGGRKGRSIKTKTVVEQGPLVLVRARTLTALP